MSESALDIFLENLHESFCSYYEQQLMQTQPCWNDAIFRAQCEQAWLKSPCKVDAQQSNESVLRTATGHWTSEQWFSFLETRLACSQTVLLYITARCAEEDRGRCVQILQSYLTEELLMADWDAPCDAERIQKMDQFAEAAQLMECTYPEEFAAFCLKQIVRIPLENEYVPELLLKGIVHTCAVRIHSLLQDPGLHMGIKIGLANYICESDIRHETIYTVLKTMFKQAQDSEEQHFLGILLGEYGDGRAIPVLRKYLEKLCKQAPFNPDSCREIASAIYKLGGQYDDIFGEETPF